MRREMRKWMRIEERNKEVDEKNEVDEKWEKNEEVDEQREEK